MSALSEAFVLIIGTLTVSLTFGMMVALAYLSEILLRRLPASLSRFLLFFGVATAFDPLLIALVDLCDKNWEHGDLFKLYNIFRAKEESGATGALMTTLIISTMLVLNAIMLYHYLLHVHMNGRIMDVHYRLHAPPGVFCVPNDMEVSIKTLRWVILRSSRYTDVKGGKRKIVVSKFRTGSDEPVYHLAIYHQSLKGERELYRHFLQLSDGSVVELFDRIPTPTDTIVSQPGQPFLEKVLEDKMAEIPPISVH